MAETELSELEQLAPRIATVQLGEEVLEVQPIRIGAVAEFSSTLRGIAVVFDGESLDVLWLIEHHVDDLIKATALATDKEIQWVADLPTDQFVDLVAAVLEVNADFFAHRILPRAAATMAQMMEWMASAGSIASSISPKPGTPGES